MILLIFNMLKPHCSSKIQQSCMHNNYMKFNGLESFIGNIKEGRKSIFYNEVVIESCWIQAINLEFFLIIENKT